MKSCKLQEDVQFSVGKLEKEQSGRHTLGLSTQSKLLYLNGRYNILVGKRDAIGIEHLNVIATEGVVGGVREEIAVVACHWLNYLINWSRLIESNCS